MGGRSKTGEGFGQSLGMKPKVRHGSRRNGEDLGEGVGKSGCWEKEEEDRECRSGDLAVILE